MASGQASCKTSHHAAAHTSTRTATHAAAIVLPALVLLEHIVALRGNAGTAGVGRPLIRAVARAARSQQQYGNQQSSN
jgi:hypothetical protein